MIVIIFFQICTSWSSMKVPLSWSNLLMKNWFYSYIWNFDIINFDVIFHFQFWFNQKDFHFHFQTFWCRILPGLQSLLLLSCARAPESHQILKCSQHNPPQSTSFQTLDEKIAFTAFFSMARNLWKASPWFSSSSTSSWKVQVQVGLYSIKILYIKQGHLGMREHSDKCKK